MAPLAVYGPPRDDRECDALSAIARTAFGVEKDLTDPVRALGPEILRVWRQRGEVIAGLAVYRMGQWFGGRCVPMAGIGMVAVDPARRARGVAGRLMQRALHEVVAEGYPLSVLYPASLRLYRGLGYEIAGERYEIALSVRSLPRLDRGLELREIGPEDDAAVRAACRRRLRHANGPLDRQAPPLHRLIEAFRPSTRTYAVWEDRILTGYVRYVPKWVEHRMTIKELVAATPGAGARLLAFLRDHRAQIETAVWNESPQDPLFLQLEDPFYRVRSTGHWMLRILDVPAALAGRGYPLGVQGDIHFYIQDDVFPANNGRFVLTIASGRGEVRRGGRGAVKLDVRGLAALYSGRSSGVELLHMTHYLDTSDAQATRLQRFFAGTLPWMGIGY